MSQTTDQPLVAVDIGNSRIKVGWFDTVGVEVLPQPTDAIELPADPSVDGLLAAWLAGRALERAAWVVASVNRPAAARLVASLAQWDGPSDVRQLTYEDLPLRIALPAPERVGVDRLLAAVAVNQLRDPTRPAVALDVGSAITVDWITPEGVFAGGAILPGIAMSARALHEQTDLLSWEKHAELAANPPALGTSTAAAIESGLYWGAVGAMRELVVRLSAEQSDDPQLFLTGGAAPAVADLLAADARYVPHLVLGGIATTHAARHD